MKKNILITGDSGFIGTNLKKEFGSRERLGGAYDIEGWDIKDGKDIFDGMLEVSIKKADIVYHLAAKTSVEGSFSHPEEVFITNVLGTARVAYLCALYKKKLIYPSTGAVYHRELSPYAESKAIAEEIVKGVQKSTPVVILRLYNVFGEGMSKESGSIMYNFLHDKEIVIYGDGEQKRDFVYVQDVVSVMREAIKNTWNGKTVEVGTGKSYTINYVGGLFAHFQKKKMIYKPPRREIKWSIADTQMLYSFYKKKLKTNLEKNIKELCETY